MGDTVSPAPLIELARAKINLTLRILGRRADGYHEIESLVTFADVGDVVTLTPGTAEGVTASGPFAAAITGYNLVARALAAVKAAAPDFRTGHIHIDKRLPVASGIGGGSADAAATLRALRTLNAARAYTIDWSAVAASLGADVPACLASRPLNMRGIGDRIERLEPPPAAAYAVLVTPQIAVPADKTAAVFRARAALPFVPSVIDDSGSRLPLDIATYGNDLEAAALTVMLEIAVALAALRATAGAMHARLSGAGPTCFALYPTLDDANAAAVALHERHPNWWVMPTTLG